MSGQVTDPCLLLSYKKKNLIPIQYIKKKKFFNKRKKKKRRLHIIDLYEKLFLERIETLIPITVTSIV